MAKTISIGELRQNPTRMLREVKGGATYTITDRGEPIAEVASVHGPRWRASEDVDAMLRELGADDQWAGEISAGRSAEKPTDPWERSE